ncbi:MAG: tetratricopeptide repeat protein, partial [Planctomycetota bacterium]
RVSLRADNEFLDVLNEYGLVGLIGLGTIAVAACVQSVLSSRQSGLAAGGAIGTLAVVMHSCVDFGLRVPATGVFALVVVMLICAQSPTARRRSSGSRSGRSGRRSARMASPTSSSQAEFTELHESVPPAFAEPGSIGRGLSIVMALFVIVVSLGAIRIRRRYFEAENARLLAREKLVDLAYDDGLSVMERSVAATPEDAFMRMEAVRVAEFVHDQALRSSQRSSATEAILRHSRILLQQCPLDWHGYAWIAQHDRTLGSELQMDHVRKARSLHPSQPDLAFLAGQLAMDRNGVEAALPHWRDSLATSLRHLPKIHEALQGRLSADQWTTALLPMDPVVSVAAANEQQDDALRNSILEWTLELLAQPDQIIRTPSPGQWEALRGETLARLNRYDEAIAIMRRGINLQPDNVSWRLTLADWCLSQDRLDDAVREIRIVLTLDPKNGRALQLQTEVSKRKAQGGN